MQRHMEYALQNGQKSDGGLRIVLFYTLKVLK